jgi:hypothetical protein
MDEEDRRSIDFAIRAHATSRHLRRPRNEFHLVLRSLIPASMISQPTLEQVLSRALKRAAEATTNPKLNTVALRKGVNAKASTAA